MKARSVSQNADFQTPFKVVAMCSISRAMICLILKLLCKIHHRNWSPNMAGGLFYYYYFLLKLMLLLQAKIFKIRVVLTSTASCGPLPSEMLCMGLYQRVLYFSLTRKYVVCWLPDRSVSSLFLLQMSTY